MKFIDERCTSVGVGPLTFDVEMARRHGWTDRDINMVWMTLEAVVRGQSTHNAVREGKTVRCQACECFTYADRKECHLCEADRERIDGRLK